MAETKLTQYTEQEKLNKMEVDFIDVTVSVDIGNTGAQTLGGLLWKPTEIPNAVAVPGGTAILQSCCAIINGGDGDGADTGPIDVVILSENFIFYEDTDDPAETEDLMSDMINTVTDMDAHCGFFNISNAFDAGVVAIGDKRNIGMVCKAASGSTSLYVYGIAQNESDYNKGSIVFRFGFLKD